MFPCGSFEVTVMDRYGDKMESCGAEFVQTQLNQAIFVSHNST